MIKIMDRLKHNFGLKILAFLLAILTWSFVITMDDPARARTVKDVPVQLIGLEALEDAGLIIRNTEVFDHVSVQVDVRISEMSRLNVGAVSVRADLTAIQRKGTYEVYLLGTTTIGEAVSVSPVKVTLEVDDLITREIPVAYAYEGKIADALYHDEPQLSTQGIEITGARTDVERVTSAVCLINLAKVKESVNSSYELTLLDRDNQVVSSALFVNTLPVVTVKMDVYPRKVVPLNSTPALCIENLAAIAPGYEISSISFSQNEVALYGPQEVLDTLATLGIRPVKVDGLTDSKTFEVELLLPDKVKPVGLVQVKMTVTIIKTQP